MSASASARWIAGRVSRFSMDGPREEVLTRCLRGGAAPVGAPLARTFAAALAPRVLHGAGVTDEQLEQLAQRGLVARAPDAAGRHAEGDGARDLEQDVGADAPNVRVEVALRDLSHATK